MYIKIMILSVLGLSVGFVCWPCCFRLPPIIGGWLLENKKESYIQKIGQSIVFVFLVSSVLLILALFSLHGAMYNNFLLESFIVNLKVTTFSSFIGFFMAIFMRWFINKH